MLLSLNDVIRMSRATRSKAVWTRRQAWYVLKLMDSRLAADARGELELDVRIYLPKSKITDMLWLLRKRALAVWKEHRLLDQQEAQAAAAELAQERAAV